MSRAGQYASSAEVAQRGGTSCRGAGTPPASLLQPVSCSCHLSPRRYQAGRLLQKAHTFDDVVAGGCRRSVGCLAGWLARYRRRPPHTNLRTANSHSPPRALHRPLPAAADFLVASKYTSADRLALWGRSAGGLTAGATINRQPELFQVGREGAVLLHFCKPPEGCHACKPQPCCGCVGAAWRRRRRLTLPYKQCHLSAHLHAVFPFTSRAAILEALAHGCGLHSITTWPAHACLEPPLSTPTSRAAILDAPAHGGGLHSLPTRPAHTCLQLPLAAPTFHSHPRPPSWMSPLWMWFPPCLTPACRSLWSSTRSGVTLALMR